MIDADDILKHISNASFQNLNQVLRTFDDPVEGAYIFNDSRYMSLKSDSLNARNGSEIGPVAIDSVHSIISRNVNGIFLLLA